jgi:predicted nucleotidyltransferase
VELPERDQIDHAPGRAQGWTDVDADVRAWVDAIVDTLHEVDGLLGVYLHGSLAMGSFFRPKSDLDLLVVVRTSLEAGRRPELAQALLRLFDDRPIVGGLEVSVVLRRSVAVFEHPAPYELHFSEAWADEVRAGGCGPSGTDPDLAAHCAVLRSRGIALAGPPPQTVFGEVPRDAYLDAILDDLRWILDVGIVTSPYYGVLNICRCAQVLLGDAELPPSKDEAAVWALAQLPEQHAGTIADALACYRSAAAVPADQRRHHGHRWDEPPLLDLAAWARHRLLGSS